MYNAPTTLPDEDTLFSALMDKDISFEGIFFFGVRSTGIFCRPTCTAKKPKRENVIFYKTTKDALNHGYRPCKICQPMTPYGATPEWLKPLFAEIQNRPDAKLADFEILEKGIDPARARRWFKKHHGMTFHSYMRSLRISKAFGQIKHDETIMNTALDSGFDSLSGFGDAFKKTTGFAPSESRKNRIISITRILTPLGPMFAGAVEEGICLLEFSDRRMLETQLSRIKKAFKAKIVPGDHPHFVELNRQLKAYFSGELREFDLPLQLTATQFQQDVWNALVKIPYSETRSYQEQAVSIGKPKAVRAVATANGDNRISIIIPCHRVIGKNGSLTGYGGGLWRKRYLLDLEKKNARQNL